jgi:two-component system, OmpR family, sensor histidine kinase VicK
MSVPSNSPIESIEEKTEIIYGEENTVKKTLEDLHRVKEKVDNCIDSTGPSVIATTETVRDAFAKLRGRGIKIRFITEITKENIHYYEELMKISDEVRHLDEIKGNFAVTEFSYAGAAVLEQARPLSHQIISTVRVFVQQQQYFFEMLWKKSIPAKQRIKEIEENIKREFIETIRNSEETISLISKVLSTGTEEILMIFSRAGTLKQYEKLGMFDIIRKKAEEDIEVRILIGMDKPFNRRELEWLEEYPRIELRFLNRSIQTSITTIVTDRELSLVIEEKEEKNDIDLGLATYSNSESTVLSFASIFENLWAQSTVRSLQTTR